MSTPSNRHKGAPLALTFAQTFPATASAVTIGGVHTGKFDRGISQKMEAADGDGFHTAQFQDFQVPTVSFDSIQAFAAAGITGDLRGTIAFKVADVVGGITAASGGYQFTMTNAFLSGHNMDFAFREFSKASTTFGCISADGTTNPVTIAAL